MSSHAEVDAVWPRAMGVVVLVAASVLAACGGGSTEVEAGATTAGPPPSTTSTSTSTSTTTTTLSEEQVALEAMAGFTSQQDAEFRLFANPPVVPGPLPGLTAPVEPIPDSLPSLRAGPDGRPVLDDEGNEIFVGVRFDALGRLLAAEDGRLLDDAGGEIPRDDQGPIVLAVQFEPDGTPSRDPAPPAPSPGEPGATEPGAEPAPARPGPVRYERRSVLPADRVLALGDSVLLGTQGTLPGALEGWTTVLDARESRLPGQGAEILRTRSDVGRVAVIMLGHNVGPGENYRVYLDNLQAAVDARPAIDRVIWVTAAEIDSPQLGYNEALRTFVAERRDAGDTEAHLADWALFNAANPGFSDDGLHLTGDGRGELSALVARFVGPPPGDCNAVIGAGARVGECV